MLRLKLKRIERGLRQSDVERVTNIPQPKLSRYERGVAKPTDEDLSKLDTLFELSSGS